MSEGTLKIVFMGSPEFAVPTLDALRGHRRFDLALVVTQPDRPKGRGKKLAPTAVKDYALSHGLPCAEMSKQNYAGVAADLARLEPHFVVVAAFGIILKDDILSLPRLGCVNLHASLLPKYRGVSPIQAAILAGDELTGCTTMLMDAGIDTGDILLSEKTAIHDGDTAGTLSTRLASIGGALVVRTLEGMVDGRITPVKQDDAAASYAKKIRKEDGLIDWSDSAVAVWRRVRAMSPWPAAYTFLGRRRLIVSEAAVSSRNGRAGRVESLEPLLVGAGDGCLEIKRVKVEGKKETDAASFLAGHGVAVGDTLGRTG